MSRFYIMCLLFLVGCAGNPFSRFYNDSTGGVDVRTLPRVVQSNEEPKLYRGNNVDEDCMTMRQNGYELVGFSSFNAGNVDVKGAIDQAKDVHAHIILVYSQYTNTNSGVRTLLLPDTKTSDTEESGTIFGTGGRANYSGTSTTTTYGTKAMHIPYSVNRYDYIASYWVKCKPPRFGVHLRELNTEEREQIGSNKGALVTVIINESPAFLADVLVGDIIKRIGDTEIFDISSFSKALDLYEGQEVDVLLLRDGTEVKKRLRLNNG